MATKYIIKEARVEHDEVAEEVAFFYYLEVDIDGVKSNHWTSQTVADVDVGTTDHTALLNTYTGGTPTLS